MSRPLRFLFCAFALISFTAHAQNLPPSASATDCTHPFGLDTYMELVYTITDAKGKPAGTIRQRVVSLGTETNENQTLTTNTVLMKSGSYDSKGRLIRIQDITYACHRDTTFTDGMGEVEHDNLTSFRDRRLTYAPVRLAWPHQPTVGTALPAGGVVVQVSSSVVDIAKVSTDVRGRRIVSGPEAMATPAGTFQVYKVECEREASTAPRPDIVVRNVTRVVNYYSPAVGIVKTEVFDKKGKLTETRVLASRNPGISRK